MYGRNCFEKRLLTSFVMLIGAVNIRCTKVLILKIDIEVSEDKDMLSTTGLDRISRRCSLKESKAEVG